MSDITLEKTIEDIFKNRLKVKKSDIANVCQEFDIAEFGVFGSVLRDDFRVEGNNPSDIDVLIVFKSGHRISWRSWQELQMTLEDLFKRKVDLVRKSLLKNPYRRSEILKTNCVIYEQ